MLGLDRLLQKSPGTIAQNLLQGVIPVWCIECNDITITQAVYSSVGCDPARSSNKIHRSPLSSYTRNDHISLPASALPLFKEDLIEKFGSEIVHSALHALNLIEEGDIEREMLSLAKRFGCTADALRLLAPRNPAQYFPQLDPEKRFLAFVDAVEKNRGRSLLLQELW